MKTRKLIELCEMRPAKAEARARLSERDAVSFLPMSDLGALEKNCFGKQERPLSEVEGSYTYFAEGDVLLAKITPCFENGKLGIARGLTNGAGFGSSEYFVLRPGSLLDAEFLYYFLAQDWVRELGAAAMVGAVGHKRVPKEFIENLDVPVLSLPEQKRIVAILDEAFEGIRIATANAEKNLANARELFNLRLNALLGGDGTWPVETLGTLCEFENGDRGKNYPSRSARTASGIPFINAGHLIDQRVDFSEMDFIPRQRFDLLGNGKIREGDLLFCLRGSLGKTALVEGFDEGAIASSLVILRPGERLVPKFLLAYFRSAMCTQMIEGFRNGAAQPNLSARSLAAFEIALPTLEVQQAIVSQLEELQGQIADLEANYAGRIDECKTLKQSLLSRAFSGQLTATKGLAA